MSGLITPDRAKLRIEPHILNEAMMLIYCSIVTFYICSVKHILNIHFKFIEKKTNITINDVLAKSENFILKFAFLPIYRGF